MKKQHHINDQTLNKYKAGRLVVMCLCILSLIFAVLTAGATGQTKSLGADDKELSGEIERQLIEGKLSLNFPLSVKRFYQLQQFRSNWLVSQSDAKQTWAAMLMLDCVLQFGLNHADYHPDDLLYSKLHDMLERPGLVPVAQKARFDIMLTDAIVSFANYLHYGKYNPDFSASKIDNGTTPFSAVELLQKATKAPDFMLTVTGAQPINRLYKDLQARMHAVAGVQLGDCYEFPEAEVRKMALNMERLRWAALNTDNYIHVNIPSYKLSLYHNAVVDTFRVVVGKPGNQTPALNSAVKYFTTSPEWKVPQKIFVKELLPKAIRDTSYLSNNHFSIYNDAGLLITPGKSYLLKIKQAPHRYHATQSAGCDNALGRIVFRFPNIYDIYLHDTPEQDLFYRKNRALSHGCIRVQNPVKLARILLANNGVKRQVPAMENAINKGLRKDFYLKTPVPIAVTYLTCEIVDGALVVYDDVYKLDKNLDMLMYKTDDQTLKISQAGGR